MDAAATRLAGRGTHQAGGAADGFGRSSDLDSREKLVAALREARGKLEAMREEIDKLSAPPLTYAVFESLNEDKTVNVIVDGRRRLKVNVVIDEVERLKPGQDVLLNESMNVVGAGQFTARGSVVTLKHLLGDRRAIVSSGPDQDEVVSLTEVLAQQASLKPGSALRASQGFAYEVLPKNEVEHLTLSVAPDVQYSDIGGLKSIVETIEKELVLPLLHADDCAEHEVRRARGILLYGPPGCGKTMIAQAIANDVARRISEQHGKSIKGYFMNIKGPELLNKYVGETERKLRELFEDAKERAKEGFPVIIFFDEIDSLFPARGSRISSDVENTIVPQMLALLQGLEDAGNVIVVGATNRPDLLDPALARDGRMDLKIHVRRPDREAAPEIFAKYLKPKLPFAAEELRLAGGRPAAVVERMIRGIVDALYSDDWELFELTYANGKTDVLRARDFASGAMIEGVVNRAKKLALDRKLSTGEKGIRFEDLVRGLEQAIKESEDLPNLDDPRTLRQYVRRDSPPIVRVKQLSANAEAAEPRRTKVESINIGQYL
jgi:proteasome-associated ATPase